MQGDKEEKYLIVAMFVVAFLLLLSILRRYVF